jgi:hypothetical protein
MSDERLTAVLREINEGLREIKEIVEKIQMDNNKPPIKTKRWFDYIIGR